MPFVYEIDRHRRIVFTRAIGTLSRQDLFDYQKEVWSSPEHRYFDECVDMSAAESIEGATEDNMMALAELAVEKDDPARPSKLSIRAPCPLNRRSPDPTISPARITRTSRAVHKNPLHFQPPSAINNILKNE
jgi:hypothetical protein